MKILFAATLYEGVQNVSSIIHEINFANCFLLASGPGSIAQWAWKIVKTITAFMSTYDVCNGSAHCLSIEPAFTFRIILNESACELSMSEQLQV
uniref:Uncharacterized protein n=1 Tax=Arion vulgaris TaxID=1028688 RepID=A0A0B7BLB7_9EUPU